MNQQQPATQKTMVGIVTSDKMQQTVTVEVTTFKVHPLYHKRFRWTTKYLSDSAEVQPKIGDTVRIRSSRPLSKLKRWVVTEIIREASATKVKVATKAKSASAAKPKAAAKKKAK